MNNLTSLQEIARAIRNLIRTGIVTDVDPIGGLCRVQTGGIQTTWLNWLTARAGRSRSWWAPSVGEQVLLLAIGGELDTAFVLPGIFSDDNPAPSASPDAFHIAFPDGAASRSYIDQSKSEYNITLGGGVAPGGSLDRQLRDAVEKLDREKRARQRSSMMHD